MADVGGEMMEGRDRGVFLLFVGSLVASFVDGEWIDKARDKGKMGGAR
jgi:hypothetical protein